MPYIMTLMSLFGADSIIKYLIENNIIKNKDYEIVVIKKYHNKGAMLNIGEGKQRIVAFLSLTFSAFVTGMFVITLGMKGKTLLKTGLSLILGGAYSNTYDRLRRKYVVDYLSFRIPNKKDSSKLSKKLAGKLGSIIFNISDFGIIIGAMLLVISELNS